MRSPSRLRTLNEIVDPLTLPAAMVTAALGSPVCCTVPLKAAPSSVRSSVHGAPGTSMTCQRPEARPQLGAPVIGRSALSGVAVVARTGGADVDGAVPGFESRRAVN